MSPILRALQVHADEDGFVDAVAAFRRAGLSREVFNREMCLLLRINVLRGANRVRGVKGIFPESGYQLAERWR